MGVIGTVGQAFGQLQAGCLAEASCLSACASAGTMLTALLAWGMQSVLQTSPTPAAFTKARAPSANSAWVTATSTEAAPAASKALRRLSQGVARAGHVVHQNHGPTLHRQIRELNHDIPITAADLVAHAMVPAMASGSLRHPLQRLFIGPDQHGLGSVLVHPDRPARAPRSKPRHRARGSPLPGWRRGANGGRR